MIEAIISHTREEQLNNLRKLLKSASKRRSPFYTLKATRKRISVTAKLFRKAYQRDSIVAWRTSFVPTEILYALDIIPFAAESVISMFAASNLTADILSIAEESFCSRDICSFLRGTMGASVANYLPAPDFLICTSLYCDGSSKLFQSLARKYKKDFFYIDVPYHHDQSKAVDYVAKQLEDLIKKISNKIGIKIDLSKLSKTIEYSNEARRHFQAAMELRKHIPSPMLGGEAIDYAVMLAHTWGHPEIVEVYKLLYEELKERVDNNKGALEEERFRLLWRQLRPYYTDVLFEYLELKNNAIIGFEEANYIHWEEIDVNEPFKGLAKKLLSNPPLGPFDRWLNLTIKEGVKKYKVDGVIEFAQWGCRHLNSGTQILKEALQKLNIPLLVLEGDCVDRRDFSEGQIRNRIDAFLEILANRKRGG